MPTCGHSEKTCHNDVCLRDPGAHPAPIPEIEIERARTEAIVRAWAEYHLAVAVAEDSGLNDTGYFTVVEQAERELDEAIAEANIAYEKALCDLRHKTHNVA